MSRKPAILGATALSATAIGLSVATPAHAGVELKLGGFMQQYFGYAAIDTDLPGNFDGFDVKSNSEVWFVGEATLDNGVKFGVNIQLEGNSNAADQIDESYLFVEGAFGLFNIGSENSAGYLMTFAAPDVGIGINSGTVLIHYLPLDGDFAGAGFLRGPLGTTFVELDRNDDSEKITYFTPRFAGFQFGASYLPDPLHDSNAQVNEATVSYRNGVSLGGNFVESFNGLDVAVSGRYDWADDRSPAGTNPSLWSVGINLGYAGFTLGGSYARTDDMDANTGRAFDVGASYETGPWGLSITYFNGRAEADAAVPGDSTYKAYEGAVSYALGPGIKTIGSVTYQNLDADTGQDSDTWAIVAGLKLEF